MLIVDCFRGEIHQSGEAGPPERPQSKARRPLARRKIAHGGSKNIRPSQTHIFIPHRLPNHTRTDQVTTSPRSSIAVSPSLLAAWGFAAAPVHPRDAKRNSLVSDAGKTSLLLGAAIRGGRVPSLASLVANGCFLTSLAFIEFRAQTGSPSIGHKAVFCLNFH